MLTESEHPNSHIVYVRRSSSFATANRKELAEYFAESIKSVGSYFTKGSIRTATGLTPSEEDLLMPDLLSIPKEDRDFRPQVNTFFQNLDTKVPAKEGIPLEIGLEVDNSKPVSADNKPLNVDNFIRWRQIKGHPFVGSTEEEAKGNQLKQFYIYDPKAVSKSNNTLNDDRDTAMTYYLTIKTDVRKVLMYLVLLNQKVNLISKGNEASALRDLVNSNPAKFIELVTDKDKEMKYLIEEMINYKILERIGDRIISAEGGGIIGRNMKEAVLHLSDSKNTKDYAILKGRLQEQWKKNSISVDLPEDILPSTVSTIEGTETKPVNLPISEENPPHISLSKESGESTTLEEVV